MSETSLLVSRFKIIKSLGTGGFGEAFLAEDTHWPQQRICVVKQLKPIDDNPEVYQIVKERFLREAVLLEELGKGHPQIPCLYAYFEDQGRFYLVQEFIEGDTLADLVRVEGPLSEARVETILLKVLDVLEYIQQKQMIHRDIKPDNIIIRRSDQMPVLIDFGAVRESMGTVLGNSANTNSSIVIGTPGYMPPEQAIGRPVCASDLYALGLTVIYALRGKALHELGTDPMTGEIIWKQGFMPTNPVLANVIDQAIYAHASQRFMTASLMKAALRSPIAAQTEGNPPTIGQVPRTEVHRVVHDIHQPGPDTLVRRSQALGSKQFLVGGLGAVVIGAVAIASIPVYLRQQNANNGDAPVKAPTQPDLLDTSTKRPQEFQNTPNIDALDQQQAQARRQEALEKQRQLETSQAESLQVWRSESNLTRLVNLKQICSGKGNINTAQTVFGYENTPLTGTLSFPTPITGGCSSGDTLQGSFKLNGSAGSCNGSITVTWQNNDTALIAWDIANIGPSCPATNRYWKISTYPVSL
jgi:serine/threonine protein kinase